MSLIPFTADVSRDAVVEDAGGGEVTVPGQIYGGLSCTFNYYRMSGGKSERRFEAGTGGKALGPGPLTNTLGVVIFDPKPAGATIEIDDRIEPNPPVAGVPPSLKVIGVRTYEVTLQCDVEFVI